MGENEQEIEESGRNGMVAVVGRANVGKSTLINHLLEEKVSIVSPIAQTTRNLIRGILTEPRGQLVFLDTPGVHKASNDLGKIMNRLARASIDGTDVVMLVVDASLSPRLEDEGWMRRLIFEDLDVLVILNKCDKDKDASEAYKALWTRVEEEKEQTKSAQWMSVSALTGVGTDELLNVLFARMPMGPMLFPADVLTDFPRKLAISDFVREKFFEVLRNELPHSVAVEVDEIDESEDRWVVAVNVFVERPSQKGIVIGHKGRLIRRVKRSSEKELADVYGRPVRVNIKVKIEKNWSKNFWMLKRLGYRE